jgi:hypothetical protein
LQTLQTLLSCLGLCKSVLIQFPSAYLKDWARNSDRPAATGYSSMMSAELRKPCDDRGIRWCGVKAGKHLSKPEMLAALTAFYSDFATTTRFFDWGLSL